MLLDLWGWKNIAHAANLPIHQPDLDAVRMGGRVGEDVLDDAGCSFSGSLIGLEHDFYS